MESIKLFIFKTFKQYLRGFSKFFLVLSAYLGYVGDGNAARHWFTTCIHWCICVCLKELGVSPPFSLLHPQTVWSCSAHQRCVLVLAACYKRQEEGHFNLAGCFSHDNRSLMTFFAQSNANHLKASQQNRSKKKKKKRSFEWEVCRYWCANLHHGAFLKKKERKKKKSTWQPR